MIIRPRSEQAQAVVPSSGALRLFAASRRPDARHAFQRSHRIRACAARLAEGKRARRAVLRRLRRAAARTLRGLRVRQRGRRRILRRLRQSACRGQGSPRRQPRAWPTAERRQLTLLFCDLCQSTALSDRLDPEDMREVLEAYRARCAAALDRYRGTVAYYMGDGILAYFGYPTAHEDDAVRAVRAALEMVPAVGSLGRDWPAPLPLPLQVRIAIHTGLVVAGEIGVDQPAHRALGRRRGPQRRGPAAGHSPRPTRSSSARRAPPAARPRS